MKVSNFTRCTTTLPALHRFDTWTTAINFAHEVRISVGKVRVSRDRNGGWTVAYDFRPVVMNTSA